MVRSGASGLVTTVLDLASMIGFVELMRLPYAFAAACASAVGAVINFSLNKWWAFRDPDPLMVGQMARFAAVAAVTAVLVASGVHLLAVALPLPYLLAKASAQVGVFAAWSYPAQARLVFRRRD